MAVKRLTGKLIDIGLLARNTYLLKIEFEEEVEFIPGQFVSMKVNDEGLRRSYSIASLPKGKEIELLVDIAPMGVGSKYILSLKKGDFMEFLCFLGKFTIDEESLMKDKILFVGTGAGIAPLKPMIEDLLNNKKYTGRVNLIWGMRHEDDLYWQEEFKDIQDRFGTFLAIRWPTDDFYLYDDISILQDIFPAVFSYLFEDKSIIENCKVEGATNSYNTSGVYVLNGIIYGGIDDHEPLFLSDN